MLFVVALAWVTAVVNEHFLFLLTTIFVIIVYYISLILTWSYLIALEVGDCTADLYRSLCVCYRL